MFYLYHTQNASFSNNILEHLKTGKFNISKKKMGIGYEQFAEKEI